MVNTKPLRPKDLKRIAQSHTQEALNALLGVIRNPKARSTSVIAAARVILAYGHGTPVQAILVDDQTSPNSTALEYIKALVAKPVNDINGLAHVDDAVIEDETD